MSPVARSRLRPIALVTPFFMLPLTLIAEPNPYDKDAVSLSKDVYPIIRKKCGACHSPGQENGGLHIGKSSSEYYLNLTEGIATSRCSPPINTDSQPTKRLDIEVAKLAPERTFFLTKLTTGKCGSQMSIKGFLNTKELETIVNWVRQGAKNN